MTKLQNINIDGIIWSVAIIGDKMIPLRPLGKPGYRLTEKKAA